jgi:hypothetical protein
MEDEQRKRKRIEEEVRRTLESINDLEDIKAGPYFYSRVRQRIAVAEGAPKYWLERLFGYRLAPSLLAALLLLNVATAWMIVRTNDESRSEYLQDGIEGVAREYSLDEGLLKFDSDAD